MTPATHYNSWKDLKNNFPSLKPQKYDIHYRNQEGSFLIPSALIIGIGEQNAEISHRKVLKRTGEKKIKKKYSASIEYSYKTFRWHLFPRKQKIHKSLIKRIIPSGKDGELIYSI